MPWLYFSSPLVCTRRSFSSMVLETPRHVSIGNLLSLVICGSVLCCWVSKRISFSIAGFIMSRELAAASCAYVCDFWTMFSTA